MSHRMPSSAAKNESLRVVPAAAAAAGFVFVWPLEGIYFRGVGDHVAVRGAPPCDCGTQQSTWTRDKPAAICPRAAEQCSIIGESGWCY